MNDPDNHKPPSRARCGCLCNMPPRNTDGTYDWHINPDCDYHKQATQNPDDHTYPWNCPTYHAGCHCDERVNQ